MGKEVRRRRMTREEAEAEVAEVAAALAARLDASGEHVFQLTEREAEVLLRWRPSQIGNPGNPKIWTMADDEIPPADTRQAAVMLHARDDGICGICHTAVDIELRHPHPASASVDHVIFTSQGGPHIWGNVRLSHRQCNMERNDERDGPLDPAEAVRLLERAVLRHEHPEIFLPQELARYLQLAADARAAAERHQGLERRIAKADEERYRDYADMVRRKLRELGLTEG